MRNLELPTFVYRAFDNETYAKDFVDSGRIRLRALRKYQDIEDLTRRDSTEGVAHVRFPDVVTTVHYNAETGEAHSSQGPGTMHSHASMGNQIYILCTSLPQVDIQYLREQFGRHVVRIGQPRRLATDLQRALDSAQGSVRGRVDFSNVEYTKGDLVAADPGPGERYRLSYIQKLREFAPQHEFRFAVIVGGAARPTDLSDSIDLDLGGRVSYAELL